MATKKSSIIETDSFCVMQLSEKCKTKKGFLSKRDFYKTTSDKFSNGYTPICKHCIQEYIYVKKQLDETRFKEILMICDYPFFQDIFEKSLSDKKEVFGVYVKNVLLKNQKSMKDNNYRLTWKDSSFGATETINKPKQTKTVDVEKLDLESLSKKWGKNFTADELEYLEESYKQWEKSSDVSVVSQERIVKRICIKELRIYQAESAGEPTDKLDESYIKLMNSGNLTPKVLADKKNSDSKQTVPMKIRDIELYHPAEFFKKKKVFEDVDDIYTYYKDLLLRPLLNLLVGHKDFRGKYSIEECNIFGDETDFKKGEGFSLLEKEELEGNKDGESNE